VAFRIDFSAETLRPARRMADGRIIVDAYLARTGVQTYTNADGSLRKEYRPPDEVFHADALASFQALPVTDDHPSTMLSAENAMQHARGASLNVRQDGDRMAGELVIFDANLAKKMERGKRQVSNGYSCDLDLTPGVDPATGETYDCVQRNIRGNHVAIVDVGRAGNAYARMDADTAISVGGDPLTCTPAKSVHNSDRDAIPDGTTLERANMDELQKAIEKAAVEKARADKLEQEVADLKAAAAKVAAEPDPKLVELTTLAATEKVRADKALADLATEKARADRLDGECLAARAAAELAEKMRTDAAEANVKATSAAVEAARAETAAKLAKEASERADAIEKARKEIAERMDVESKARAVLGAEVVESLAAASTLDIKRAVIAKVCKADVSNDKPAAYVDGAFDRAVEQFSGGDAAARAARSAIGNSSANTLLSERDATKKMQAAYGAAWQGSK
jgi:hypothetical protein